MLLPENSQEGPVSVSIRPFDEDRYRRITVAMVDPAKRQARHSVITFVRKVKRCADLSDFFNHADDADMRIVEQHLGITNA